MSPRGVRFANLWVALVLAAFMLLRIIRSHSVQNLLR